MPNPNLAKSLTRIRIRIRTGFAPWIWNHVEVKSWVRIRNETIADPEPITGCYSGSLSIHIVPHRQIKPEGTDGLPNCWRMKECGEDGGAAAGHILLHLPISALSLRYSN